MSDYFITSVKKSAIPIIPVICDEYAKWLENQTAELKNWLRINEFKAKSGSVCLMPDKEGKIKQVFLGINNPDDFWAFGALPNKLPEGNYAVVNELSAEKMQRIAIAWGLGGYKFTVYKKSSISKAKLFIAEKYNLPYIENIIRSISLVRDLINYPAEDMDPAQLTKTATSTAIEFGGNVDQIIGDDLIKKGYNAIHIVGRASDHPPRLIDLKWGKEKNPKIILIGKGVCFDSGGLDIKSSTGMERMKKDMGGAAHVLGLARMIMAADLPVNLRVLIPAVENMVAGNSYKPGDVITTYKGITVEITNTDAEGRLILADALALASEDEPELLIDFATLTVATNIALGNEIAALFTHHDDLAKEIINYSIQENDPICHMPIYQPYARWLDSNIADICNAASVKLGGAITAALFLQEFVDRKIPWLHFDLMGYNVDDTAGKPKGGEALGLRAVFNYLLKRYG
jgi:leucyl aminopeptidase